MGEQSTFVVIPGLNEEKYLRGTLRGAKRAGFRQLIYVDDGSHDASPRIAKSEGAIVLRHARNRGKGAALRSGCDEALRRGARKIILMDADQQHDPADLTHLEKALDHNALVYTKRDFSREMPIVPRIGNWFFTATIKILYGIKVSDALNGYRGMTAAAYQHVRWNANNYQVEAEIIVRAARLDLHHTERKTKTIYLERGKGTTPLDGLPILWALLKWRFKRL